MASISANNNQFNWSACAFFEKLTAENKLARQHGFTFCEVSGLEGFEQALQRMQSTLAFVCVSDESDGYTVLDNAPHTRRVKTVFLAMRHAIEDMEAREKCMAVMRELFRQFMSRYLLEATRLRENCLYPDSRISFKEISRYFFSGGACAYFQLAIDTQTNLMYKADEWDNQ